MTSDLATATNLNGDRTGETRLWVAGEAWTDDASDQIIEFQEDAGGSRMTFTSRRPMEKLIEARVLLQVGTSRGFEPLFTGKLTRPMPDPATFGSAATALGPFAQMAEQSYGEPYSFNTMWVKDALKLTASLAGYAQGIAVILGGGAQKIEDLQVAEETRLLEGAQAICETADLVMTDTGEGNRVFLPRPHPGGGAATQTVYTADHYKSFSVEQEYPTTFSKVIVIRRDSEDAQNGYEIRAVRPVPQPYDTIPAPRNRILYITDFAGDEDAANQTAYDTARRLGLHGQVTWSMTELPLEPIARYSSLRGERIVEYSDGFYKEIYDLTVHDGVSYNVKEWKMDIGGEGLLLSATKIAPARADAYVPPSSAIL